jgi:hypothetical protein
LKNDDRLESRRAWLLGSCLILYGHLQAVHHQSASAVKSYLEALSFADDLGQADFETTLIGMFLAKPALEGLSELIGRLDKDSVSLEEIWQQLALFETKLPRMSTGIRLARLRTATNLQIDSDEYVRGQPWELSHVPSRRAIAAWRLARSEPLLKLLFQIADANGTHDREKLAAEIEHAVETANNQTVSDGVPDNCIGAVKSEAYLHRIYRSTQAAIRLRQWRDDHGRYPADAMPLMLRFDEERLRYETSQDGNSYKIIIDGGEGEGTVLLEQPSKPARR